MSKSNIGERKGRRTIERFFDVSYKALKEFFCAQELESKITDNNLAQEWVIGFPSELDCTNAWEYVCRGYGCKDEGGYAILHKCENGNPLLVLHKNERSISISERFTSCTSIACEEYWFVSRNMDQSFLGKSVLSQKDLEGYLLKSLPKEEIWKRVMDLCGAEFPMGYSVGVPLNRWSFEDEEAIILDALSLMQLQHKLGLPANAWSVKSGC